ncbi:MAG: SirB1 family protein [Pyrinomonadaceae bacterium]
MTPAGKLLAGRARQEFAAAIQSTETRIDLARVALLIAAEEEPPTDVAHYLALLDELGGAARVRINQSDDDPVETFNQFMFEELGFNGNQVDYYNARNSFLNEVLESRTGIPITLSIAYMEIGRRAGLAVEGIGLPGHFIVRVSGGQDVLPQTFVDPFHRRTLTSTDCQDLLDTVYGGHVALTQAHLRAATDRQILVRLLTNLKGVYAAGKLPKRALSVVERILLLAPDSLNERRDRGALLAQLGRTAEALDELKRYLRNVPDAPDEEAVRTQLKELQTQHATLN